MRDLSRLRSADPTAPADDVPIPPDLKAEFSASVRARGHEYWREGRVHVVKAGHDRLEAQVRGTRTYRAALHRERSGIVTLACSCPFVEEYDEPCKHLWALMLEAERIEHPLIEDAPHTGAKLGRTAPRPVKPPAAPDWQRELRRLAAKRPHDRLARDPGAWPADRRIAYVVDVAASATHERGLILELAVQALAHDE